MLFYILPLIIKQLQPSVDFAVRDRPVIKADGEDLCYVTVSMTDKDGNFCPLADDQLTFEGEGEFKCVCKGDATSLEPFTKPTMKLFNGQLVVTVKSTTKPDKMTLKVRRPATSQKTKKQAFVSNEIESSIEITTK